MTQVDMYKRALLRPVNFEQMSAESRWAIDKSLGILDWDGGCAHDTKKMCPMCLREYRERDEKH